MKKEYNGAGQTKIQIRRQAALELWKLLLIPGNYMRKTINFAEQRCWKVWDKKHNPLMIFDLDEANILFKKKLIRPMPEYKGNTNPGCHVADKEVAKRMHGLSPFYKAWKAATPTEKKKASNQ